MQAQIKDPGEIICLCRSSRKQLLIAPFLIEAERCN